MIQFNALIIIMLFFASEINIINKRLNVYDEFVEPFDDTRLKGTSSKGVT